VSGKKKVERWKNMKEVKRRKEKEDMGNEEEEKN
jgi:hypothetical protein